MEKYNLEKHRKLVELGRLGFIIIMSILIFLNGLSNLIVGLPIGLTFGLIDQNLLSQN